MVITSSDAFPAPPAITDEELKPPTIERLSSSNRACSFPGLPLKPDFGKNRIDDDAGMIKGVDSEAVKEIVVHSPVLEKYCQAPSSLEAPLSMIAMPPKSKPVVVWLSDFLSEKAEPTNKDSRVFPVGLVAPSEIVVRETP